MIILMWLNWSKFLLKTLKKIEVHYLLTSDVWWCCFSILWQNIFSGHETEHPYCNILSINYESTLTQAFFSDLECLNFSKSTFILKLEEILSVLKFLVLSLAFETLYKLIPLLAILSYPLISTPHTPSCLSLCLAHCLPWPIYTTCAPFWTLRVHSTLYSSNVHSSL